MSDHNWLVKLCSEQPVNEVELEQALNELSPEQLMSLDTAPSPNADVIQDKVAFADQMGRELAQKDPGLLQKAEENKQLQDAIGSLTDEEAVKVAHVLEHGTELEKKAFLGAIGRMAAKAVTSGAGKKVVKTMAKNPLTATTAVGAGAGAIMGGEGNRLQGAMAGGALGAAGGALAGRKAIKKVIGRGYGAAAKAARPGISGARARGAGMVGPLRQTGKFASVEMLQKAAFMHMESHRNEWLEQFEGTPLLESALDMAKQELEVEKQEIQERAARKEQFQGQDESWARHDEIRLGKRALELQLIEQRNGIGGGGEEEMQPGAEEEPPAEEPAAMPPEGAEADPAQATVESPAGQEAVGAIKEAATKLAMQQKHGLASALAGGVAGHIAQGKDRDASPRSGALRGAAGGFLGGTIPAMLAASRGARMSTIVGLNALGGGLGGYLAGRTAKATPAEVAAHKAATGKKKTASLPR